MKAPEIAIVDPCAPDPRIVEDLIVRGELSLKRSARDDAAACNAITAAAVWLLAQVRERLRVPR